MTKEKIVKRYQDVQFTPTFIDGDNCNLTQAIFEWLEERHPGENSLAEAAIILTDISLKTCQNYCTLCQISGENR